MAGKASVKHNWQTKTYEDLETRTFYIYYFEGDTNLVKTSIKRELGLNNYEEVEKWIELNPAENIDPLDRKTEFEEMGELFRRRFDKKKLKEAGLWGNIAMKSGAGKNQGQTPRKTQPDAGKVVGTVTPIPTPTSTPTPTPTTTPSKKKKDPPPPRVLPNREAVRSIDETGFYQVSDRNTRKPQKVYKGKVGKTRKGKPTKWRPGTLALRQIKYYQSTQHPVIDYAPMKRLCHQLLQKVQLEFYKGKKYYSRLLEKKSQEELTEEEEAAAKVYRISGGAIKALREAVEAFGVTFLSDSYLCSLHRQCLTLMPKDTALAKRIRGETFERMKTEAEKKKEKEDRQKALAALAALKSGKRPVLDSSDDDDEDS